MAAYARVLASCGNAKKWATSQPTRDDGRNYARWRRFPETYPQNDLNLRDSRKSAGARQRESRRGCCTDGGQPWWKIQTLSPVCRAGLSKTVQAKGRGRQAAKSTRPLPGACFLSAAL